MSDRRIKFSFANMKVKLCKTCRGLGHLCDTGGNWYRCGDCFGYGRIVVRSTKNTHTMNEFDFDSNQMELPMDAEEEEEDA